MKILQTFLMAIKVLGLLGFKKDSSLIPKIWNNRAKKTNKQEMKFVAKTNFSPDKHTIHYLNYIAQNETCKVDLTLRQEKNNTQILDYQSLQSSIETFEDKASTSIKVEYTLEK